MKLLIIPDVHGRDFWIEPCQHIDEFDKVIFLGDYHDAYPFQVSQETSRQRLKDELVPFVLNNRDKVICLMGNHDCNYIYFPMADRFDRKHQEEIKELLQQLNLQVAYKVDDYLFTHSGVLPCWLESNDLTIEDLINGNVTAEQLAQVSPRRGGYHTCGSCVWGDVSEYFSSEKIPDLYQIFGHTQLIDAFINKDFACLDCRMAFVLDTEYRTLQSYTLWKNQMEK